MRHVTRYVSDDLCLETLVSVYSCRPGQVTAGSLPRTAAIISHDVKVLLGSCANNNYTTRKRIDMVSIDFEKVVLSVPCFWHTRVLMH